MEMKHRRRTVLVIAAHPDDEVLGCGGTIIKLAREGCRVYVLLLGEGITSRDEKRNRRKRRPYLNRLKKEARRANKIMGVKDIFMQNFPDNRFDAVPLLDIVKVIEKIKKKTKPDIVFTHHSRDLNIDHRITFEAVITASRPLPDETVREIYSFEIPSSTGWGYPSLFSPNVFYEIKKTIGMKTGALKEYKSELRPFPHPRSVEAVVLNAKNLGIKAGLSYAEAFELIRYVERE